jgi:hypothetical protein
VVSAFQEHRDDMDDSIRSRFVPVMGSGDGDGTAHEEENGDKNEKVIFHDNDRI